MDTGASQSVYTVMSTSAVLAVRVSKLRAALRALLGLPNTQAPRGGRCTSRTRAAAARRSQSTSRSSYSPAPELSVQMWPLPGLATAPHLLACCASRWCPKYPGRSYRAPGWRAACPTVGQPPELRSSHCHHHAPGTILLYEAARLTHGRPRRLRGKSFVNAFIHFKPVPGERGGAGARAQ